MEYCNGGNLRDFLSTAPNNRLGYKQARKIFRCLVKALIYLQERSIVHRDIKPDNIMLNTDGTVKIVDFSVAIVIDLNKVEGNKALFESAIIPGLQSEGTPAYQAPDSQNISGHDILTCPHAMKADIWSLGIVLYVMTIGRFPFKGNNMVQLFENISSGKYDIPDWVENNLRNLLTNIININPENRYSLEEIKRHSWMKIKLPKETPIPILPIDSVFGDDK